MRTVLVAICVCGAVVGGAAASVRAVGPVPVRTCADRGELKAPIRGFSGPGDVVVGRTSFHELRRFASRTALLRTALGTGKNRIYFAKGNAVVRTGPPVTISIVPRDRHVASLAYVHGPGLGLRLGYPIERLQPCPPQTRARAYKGRVGPLTGFPGGFVVKHPACVTIVVTSPGSKAIRRVVSIGAGTCR